MNSRVRRTACLLLSFATLTGLLVLNGSTTSAQTAASKKGAGKKAATGSSDDLKFSSEIAPILVANCIRCHNPKDKARRKGLDLTTFAGIKTGGEDGPILKPGDPDESMIILRVRGEDGARMPPGQNTLAPETIARIEAWITAGARLDAGIDPSTALEKYAPSAEEQRRAKLAQLKPGELDKKLEDEGLARWKKASSTTPDVTRGAHFLMLGKLPPDRSKNLLKTLDAQHENLAALLGPESGKALSGPEKISVYVFNDAKGYAEFARGVEMREVDLTSDDDRVHANLTIEAPYLVALDPLKGGPEPAAAPAPKRSSRYRKKAAEASALSEPRAARSLAGLLAEQFTVGTLARSENAPRWLVTGLGAYVANVVEPRSPYISSLRRDIASRTDQGWTTKTRALLAGQGEPEEIRSTGFGLIEFLSVNSRPFVGPFVRGVEKDPKEFDQLIRKGLGADPAAFFDAWGLWTARNYPRDH